MSDWLDDFAAELDNKVSEETGVATKNRNLLLEFARDVAHATERKNAPLATYIVGRYAALSPKPDDAALVEALEIARSMLPKVEEP
ncbi:MAG: hypothetical protein QOG54_1176 [Actinomycetota bacterium]|jgi:hypothetical protein|nr:hypothetical protein [Actinomycetota bacterium]